jgi:dTDP-4-amino-4,6-dideoxygalactose transaminase
VKPGELSDAAAFSFYPGKNLGGVGEGGALVTNDDNIASHVQLLRNWGASVRYQHTIHAFNYRMDSIQGAALDIKLKFLAQWTEKRRTVAGWYFKHLAEIYGVELPARDQGHVYHVFAIRSRQRERIRGALGAASVEFGCHYPVPVHLQQAYSSFGYKSGDFPVAEQLANEWISLPMDPGMVEDDVRYVSNVIREESEKIEAS